MDPLVSVIIPAYNSEKWLKSSVSSALSQTWSKKEIIIIDDGSSDNTLKLAKEFESSSVKVISQKNKGASSARNSGLQIAQGDFIQWLDADDILAPDKLKIQLDGSDYNPDSKILLSSGWGFFYHRLKSVRINTNSLWQDLSPSEWMIHHLASQYFMANCSWLVSRKLTSLAGNWNEALNYNDDGEYFCRIISRSEAIKFNGDILSYYRKGNLVSLSRSLSISTKAFESLSLSLNLCIDELLRINSSEEAKESAIRALNRVISHNDKSIENILKSNKERIIFLGGQIIVPVMSKKYNFIKKFFGEKNTGYMKIKLWYLQIYLASQWDKLKSFVFNDGV